MTICVERVPTLVVAHFPQSKVKPGVKPMSDYRSEHAVVVSSLEKWRISSDVVISNDTSENVDGADRAQQGTGGIPSKWHLLLPFVGLDRLREIELYQDARDAVVLQIAYIPPADKPDEVDFVEGFWHKAGSSQHC